MLARNVASGEKDLRLAMERAFVLADIGCGVVRSLHVHQTVELEREGQPGTYFVRAVFLSSGVDRPAFLMPYLRKAGARLLRRRFPRFPLR